MNWKGYRLSFSIESPLFTGYNIPGDAERTRYYILSKNMMGALAGVMESEGYPVSAAKLQEYFIFSTFFISWDGEEALYPSLTQGGILSYGRNGMSLMDFKNQCISSREGLKYDLPPGAGEIEFIVPGNEITGRQHFLAGYVFVAEGAERQGFEPWLRCLRSMRVGEEIYHGLGRIELHELELCAGKKMEAFFGIQGIDACWESDEVVLKYGEPNPLLAHTCLECVGKNIVSIYGVREPAKGRRNLLGGGPAEEKQEAYWVPGTLIQPAPKGVCFRVGRNGIWYLQ